MPGSVAIRTRRRLAWLVMGPRQRGPRTATRRISFVMAMVDLLSCAFGAALFLFVITADSVPKPDAAPEAPSVSAFVRIAVNSASVRPIFIFSHPKSTTQFVVDLPYLEGKGLFRQVRGASSNASGGRVMVLGKSPWDASEGAQLSRLQLLIEKPAVGEWCLTVGITSDDSQARARFGNAISAEGIEVFVQPAGSAMWEAVPEVSLPTGVGLSEPICKLMLAGA